jgi:hypothetical protein
LTASPSAAVIEVRFRFAISLAPYAHVKYAMSML